MGMNKIFLGLALMSLIAFGGCLEKTSKEGALEQATTLQINVAENPAKETAQAANPKKIAQESKVSEMQEKVAPSKGVVLPVKWKDTLAKAVKAGAIDLNKYETSLALGGAKLMPGHKKLLLEGSDENISFTPENAMFNLNMLWALGLVNENPILTKGKISEYGGKKSYFASTGGWGLGKKNGGELLATAKIITLTAEQQKIVEEVAASTYRPCCSNPAAFPDCNHGMAALALAELMASQGATKDQIYDALLVANSYWFTQSYVKIAEYLDENGKDFSKADSKELLGYDYSSQNGYSRIANKLENIPNVQV